MWIERVRYQAIISAVLCHVQVATLRMRPSAVTVCRLENDPEANPGELPGDTFNTHFTYTPMEPGSARSCRGTPALETRDGIRHQIVPILLT
jgi:hypothetical protein